MLAYSFLIKSSSKLLVTRTGIKSRSSSILGRIGPLILELLALEWRKFHTFELEYLWSQLVNLDQVLCVASLGVGERLHKVLGQIDLAHWTQVSDRCPLGYLLFVWTPFWYVSVFGSAACLRFAELWCVSSGFRCRVVVGSLMRLY